MDVVDLHTHLLAGVDDGARDASEARAALSTLHDEGVETAVATPHLACSLAENDPDGWWRRLDTFGRAWEALRDTADGGAADLRVELGVELRLDASVPPLEDARIRLAGTDYVLVEFATLRMPTFGGRQLGAVAEAGAVPVLAHPERYRGLGEQLDTVGTWRDAGVLLQVNAGSLLGQYGRVPRRTAWALLERGWADAVASDYHARGDPMILDALGVVGRSSEAHARLLFGTNPRRMLDGREPKEVPPLQPRDFWDRVREMLGLG